MAKFHLSDRTAIFAIFLICCSAVMPIIVLGIPDNYDLLQHIRFADTFYKAFSEGHLLPVWGAGDNYGFGSIGIRLYPPLAYIVFALTRIAAGNWFDAFWITILFWLALGCIGIYCWAREWVDEPYALFAALLYALAPYHTFQIYQALLYSEFAVAGILPFCFLFLTRVCRRQKTLDAIFFAISVALLILSHIPSTVISLTCLFLYAAFMIERQWMWKTIVKIGAAFAAAMMASVFHWIKLLSEVGWVMHSKSEYYSTGYYDFHRYFFPLYVISPSNRYVERMLWQLDLIILISIMFFAPVAVFLLVKLWRNVKRPQIPKQHLAFLIVGLFSLFMLSMASSFLWDHLPVLPQIQFPWRWLIVATAFGPVCLVSLVSDLAKHGNRRILVYACAGFAMIVILYSLTQNILQSNPLSREVFTEQVSEMDNSEACACWWPIWAKPSAFDRKEKVYAGTRQVTVQKWASGERAFSVEPGEPTSTRVATFWYPYWKAKVNGRPTDPVPDENGVISISLPAEEADVRLYFEEPPYVGASGYISFFTWIVLLTGVAMIYLKGRMAVR